MVRYLRAVSCCLLTVLLNYPAYSATLDGIDIKTMLERFSEVAQPKPSAQLTSSVEGHVDLANALENYDFPR